jgi:hypothetical protein
MQKKVAEEVDDDALMQAVKLEHQNKMRVSLRQIKDLKISIPRRVTRVFGLWVSFTGAITYFWLTHYSGQFI